MARTFLYTDRVSAGRTVCRDRQAHGDASGLNAGSQWREQGTAIVMTRPAFNVLVPTWLHMCTNPESLVVIRARQRYFCPSQRSPADGSRNLSVASRGPVAA